VRAANSLLACVILLSVGAAAEAAPRHRFDLPAGRLGDAVVALGRQARISIGVRDPALAARKVKGVRGALSVEEALRRMLAGSGARAVALGPDTWLILRSSEPPRPRPKRTPRSPPPPPPPPPPLPPQEIEADIVVTGAKRLIHLAVYPGSATFIDGSAMTLDGAGGTDALVERVAALTSTHLGRGRNKLFIRGIADSSFNGPTQATVGQYLGETRLNYNAPDPDLRLHDVNRIELLSGPQGTLYGAGSLGGIIRVVPNPPSFGAAEAAAALGASTTRHGEAGADLSAMLNLPLASDRVALRLSGYAQAEGGYIDDLERRLDDVNDTRTIGGRAALRMRGGHGWTVDLALTGQRIRGEDAQFADRDAPPLTRRSRVAQDYRNSYVLGDLVLTKTWDSLRLVAAMGVVRQDLTERYDSSRVDGPPLLFEQDNKITMLSADTRVSKERPQGRGWLIGASFISNRSRQARRLGPPEAPVPITGVRNAIMEATLYGEDTFKLADHVNLTFGARLAHSELSGAALDAPPALAPLLRTVQASRRETSFIPSLALVARPSEELSLFARYQQGFRPGGLAVTGEAIQRFHNDRVKTVETGVRWGRAAPGRFNAAAALAYTRWRDIQADVIDFTGLPSTQNIGDGRILTLDLQLDWRPFPGLSFDLGAVLNRSRVTNPAPSIVIAPSAPLPNVARVNGRLGTEYRTDIGGGLELRLTASARYVGKSRLGIGPVLGEPQGDWLDTRLGARIERGRHTFSLSLTNLADEEGNRFALGSPFTLVERRQTTPLRPRTLRLGFETRF
jgi:iron complex outermembrane receptor protein